MSRVDPDGDPEAAERGAALFVRAQQSGDPEAVRALDAWAGSDPARRRWIDDAGRVWEGMDVVAEDPRLRLWRTQALEAGPPAARRGPQGGARWAMAASIAAFLVLGAGLWALQSPATPAQRIVSGIGERREVVLSDGSRIMLDAASSVVVTFDAEQRRVQLLRGQARFHVAKDAERPFHVEVAGDDVRAIGTDFNVSMTDGTNAVSLLEGRVLVSRVEYRPVLFGLSSRVERIPAATLKPGEQFARERGGTARLSRFDPYSVTAWQSGRLMFDNTPLREAVMLANRHSHREIVIDPAIGSIRLSGVVNAGDGLGFARVVQAYLPNTHLEVSGARIVIGQGAEGAAKNR